MNKWNKLKEYLEEKKEEYNKGILLSTREAVIGEGIYKEILEEMGNIEINIKSDLKESAEIIMDFLDSTETGCSFWVDFDGKSHTCDLGYVFEFLEDLKGYLEDRIKE